MTFQEEICKENHVKEDDITVSWKLNWRGGGNLSGAVRYEVITLNYENRHYPADLQLFE